MVIIAAVGDGGDVLGGSGDGKVEGGDFLGGGCSCCWLGLLLMES